MTQQQRDNRKDPHITFTKRSFAGGEYSPQIVQARSDLDLYQRGLVQCLNCIPLPDGSLVQRPPTRFYDSSQIPLRASRLLAFPLEIDQTVLFIFGDKQMACFTVFETDSPKFFSLWDTPYTRREAKYLDYARMGSWIILTHPSHPPHKIEIMGEDSVHFWVQEFNPPPWLGEREVNGQISNAKLQIKLTPSRKGSVYVKASEPVFKRSDVGRTLRLGYRFRFWQPKTLYPEGSYVSMYGKVYVCVHEGISGDTWVDNQRDVLLKDGQVSWKLQFNDQVLSVGKDGKSTLGTGSQARRPYYVWGRITAVRGATHATLELHKKFGVTDDSLTSDWNFGAWGRDSKKGIRLM